MYAWNIKSLKTRNVGVADQKNRTDMVVAKNVAQAVVAWNRTLAGRTGNYEIVKVKRKSLVTLPEVLCQEQT